jgi:hypothetical protein
MTNSNNYPFLTKSQLKDRISSDDEFVAACVLVMQSRQTDDEQEVRETRWKNRRGWMSSHAVRGGKLASKIESGEALSEEELDQARKMLLSYSKQLASHFRALAIEANPALKDAGSVFGVC